MTNLNQDSTETEVPATPVLTGSGRTGLRLGLTALADIYGTIGVVALLTAITFFRVLDKKLMRRLRGSTASLVVCVTVPDRTWFDPMREAAKSMVGTPTMYVWDSITRRAFSDPSVTEVVHQISKGRTVLCVSQDVGATVPRAIRTVADATISLSQPSAADVALAIALVRGERGPSRVPPNLGRGLDLHEIAACLRGGEAPRVTVDRIRRAMTSKGLSGVDLTAPRLEDLHGYGEAALWGRRVLADVAAYREGRLTWREVPGPAVLHGPPERERRSSLAHWPGPSTPHS